MSQEVRLPFAHCCVLLLASLQAQHWGVLLLGSLAAPAVRLSWCTCLHYPSMKRLPACNFDESAIQSLSCRVVMVGGGYIACEQASIYNNMGAEVHFLIRGVRALSVQHQIWQGCIYHAKTCC